MGIDLYQVDAFTARLFAGNPAAVCLLPEPASADWMQNVAAEMNLAETAFLVRQADGFDLRWFTPVVEVALCGHATLASAHVLFETGRLDAGQQARFHTLSGLLTAERNGSWIEMDFPATQAEPVQLPDGLLEGLGLAPESGVGVRYTGRSRFDYLVEVEDEQTVRWLQPDHARLRSLSVRGVIVTSRSASPEFDFVSRFFAPGAGIDEDPVTGSAHCCLAPYWAGRLGKTEFNAFQASRRGGVLRVCLKGERVLLAGQAVTVLRGELLSLDL